MKHVHLHVQPYLTLILLIWKVTVILLTLTLLLPSSIITTTAFSVARQTGDARAGADGYSLLRQPVQWDPDETPDFGPPQFMMEEEAADEQPFKWIPKMATSVTTNNDEAATAAVPPIDLVQRTLDTLEYPLVLQQLQQHVTTVPARNLIQGNIPFTSTTTTTAMYNQAYQPIMANSHQGLEARYKAVQEMMFWLHCNTDYHYTNTKGYKELLTGPPINHPMDLATLLRKTDAGQVLDGSELMTIGTIMQVMQDVLLWGQGIQPHTNQSTALLEFVHCISCNSTLHRLLLHDALDAEGRLSARTFPKIGELRRAIQSTKRSILGTLDASSMDYSQIQGRIVIPMTTSTSNNNNNMGGIVHDASRSGKTVYVEPSELIGPTNMLRQAESDLQREEAKVWRQLTREVLAERQALEQSVMAMAQLDLIRAKCDMKGVIPECGTDGIVNLTNAKHPLLRKKLNVMGSDISLGANGNQGLVLTGPNAGGKTVVLKLAGLVALMARAGIPIPADKARVDFFDPILADIGDLQSVEGDLSTFSGHMMVCQKVLEKSGTNALVLMDELGSGTDPAQGVAIAQALLEELADAGSRVVITTHYMALKQLAASDHRFAVAGMQFVNGRPTYKLVPGMVGESFALSVAERLGLPRKVIDRATELLDSETRLMGDLLRDLEDQKAVVDRQLEEMAEKQKELVAVQQELKSQQAQLLQKQLSVRRDEAKKFAIKLEEKERVLEEILEKLKGDPSRRVIARSWEEIKYVKRDVINDAEKVSVVTEGKVFPNMEMVEMVGLAELVPLAEMREKPVLKAGDKLQVCKAGSMFGKEAIVVEGGGRPQVKVDGLTINLKLTDLAMPLTVAGAGTGTGAGEKRRKGKSKTSRAVDEILASEPVSTTATASRATATATTTKSDVAIRTQSNTINVMGCSFEESKRKVEDKFVSTLMEGRRLVYILHGHGEMGTLKQKIRNWLQSERKKVKRYSSADQSDGGDAVTKVELQS